ncbi:hypothetical protein HAPAU_12550 [Halalkalicoccus paucihalophilus]|uniref:Uncharacterized protein n=1 Tax=Halalkalicoccus paucihalophilus TaxID=1008153 RepID=A0A151AES4_9EURY|nr:hypothetical protein [Halalkalicoccus paucihalophilus]KYH26161.1 hypothetical protein HAPAU_12550 [Halalkalicoccus paucihalophilus]
MADFRRILGDSSGQTDTAVTLTAGSIVAGFGLNAFAFAMGFGSLAVLVVGTVVAADLFFAGWWLVVNALVLVVRIALAEGPYSQ